MDDVLTWEAFEENEFTDRSTSARVVSTGRWRDSQRHLREGAPWSGSVTVLSPQDVLSAVQSASDGV